MNFIKAPSGAFFYFHTVITNIRFHPQVSAPMLDDYLCRGWYRIGPFVFSTDHIDRPEGNIPVVWLRYRLDGFEPDRKQLRMLKKIWPLHYSFKPLQITPELEELYRRYREKIDFFTSETLNRLLFDEIDPGFLAEPIFNSYLLEWRDGDRLIAAGVMDLGQKSSAGIVNFYDPAYQKLSLGKCLMLKKMLISQSLHMDHYYPGYIAYHYSKFDYKLFLGTERAEIFDPEQQVWVPYSEQGLKEIAEAYLLRTEKAEPGPPLSEV